MKKLAVIIGLVVAFIAFAGTTASAHHPVVTGSATCQADGTYKVTWAASPDAVRGKEWRVEIGPGYTGWQPDSQPFIWSTISPGTSTVAVANIRADWRPKGPTGVTEKGRVQLAGDCIAATTTTEAPPTTVPATTVPETTTTVVDLCPGPNNYPQSYEPDAPCGPVDPCVNIDPSTGLGTTLWNAQVCGTPVTTVVVADDSGTTVVPPPPTVATGQPPSLPETGSELTFAAIGAALLGLGFGTLRLARR